MTKEAGVGPFFNKKAFTKHHFSKRLHRLEQVLSALCINGENLKNRVTSS